MIRTTNDNPKHPTTITEPSVVSLLEDPHYIRRMLNMYLPGLVVEGTAAAVAV
jgi:hypothetical protein